MALTFPASPADGDTHDQFGVTYTYNATQDLWAASGQYNIPVVSPAAADPTTRDDGTALEEGDFYYNTTDDAIKTYDGAAWNASGGGGARTAVAASRFTAFPGNATNLSVSLSNCTAGSVIIAHYAFFGTTNPSTIGSMTASLTGATSQSVDTDGSVGGNDFDIKTFLVDDSSAGGTVTATVSRSISNLSYPYGFRVALMEIV